MKKTLLKLILLLSIPIGLLILFRQLGWLKWFQDQPLLFWIITALGILFAIINVLFQPLYHEYRLPKGRPAAPPKPRIDLGFAELQRFMSNHYDIEEIRTLCFDLGIDYDELTGEGKSAKIRELLLQVQQENQLDNLIRYMIYHDTSNGDARTFRQLWIRDWMSGANVIGLHKSRIISQLRK